VPVQKRLVFAIIPLMSPFIFMNLSVRGQRLSPLHSANQGTIIIKPIAINGRYNIFHHYLVQPSLFDFKAPITPFGGIQKAIFSQML
jgi:hypothetical protein